MWQGGCLRLVGVALSLLVCGGHAVLAEEQDSDRATTVDFDRDIRPILSDHCFRCHGPDAQQREADLRLDKPGASVIVAGSPDDSELIHRIRSTDEDVRMPPIDAGPSLTPDQIAQITTWIKQGARWSEHWAFVAPSRSAPPALTQLIPSSNPIDHFVDAKRASQNLKASPSADRVTLIRRVTLDLTGLPPTVGEIERFVSDQRPDAYLRLVDRLLASPRYGERMASPWLDAARYADTSGYQNDGPREMWRWRDWVIDALNQNVPFDEFTIQQLAGDLLPNATLMQQVATGFNRNHRGNAEGGIIPEEYAVEYVVDRVETTATVWLGLTVGCARCHDHKFDPISQREFYQLFAFFNNVPEFGRAIKEGNSPPWIKAPTAIQASQLEQYDRQTANAFQQFQNLQPVLADAQADWEKTVQTDTDRWTIERGLVARLHYDDPPQHNSTSSEIGTTSGAVGNAASFDGKHWHEVGDVAKFGYFDKFSFACWIRPDRDDEAGQRTIMSRAADVQHPSGYSVAWQAGRIHVNLVKRWLDDAIRVHTVATVPSSQWTHVCVTYDGSRTAAGVTVYLDGKRAETETEVDLLNQSFATADPLRIGGAGGRGFLGAIDEVQIYDRDLTAKEASILSVRQPVHAIIRSAATPRTSAQARKLRACFLDTAAPTEIQASHQRLLASQQLQRDYWQSLPTVMVMQEMPTPRTTFVLNRGQYDQPGQAVNAGTPACLPPLRGANVNRLSLARWITSPDHPLTARVIVNRDWQMLFGRGFVETPEDFGVQGARPSHAQLLDWLATEFVRSGWDRKHLLKQMITSATYRQSSTVTPELIRKDPDNRWLARGPRIRLPAGMIRDQALAASGLLVEQIGGPSVRPYQPDGLWQEIASDTDYQQDTGAGLYRRSLYSYWKRTVAPPSMINFDASTRETCVVRSTRTNTPLQALTLMNDQLFIETSLGIAQRALDQNLDSDAERLAFAVASVIGRRPNETETQTLVTGLQHHRSFYRNRPDQTQALMRTIQSGGDDPERQSELASWVVMANLILNLDEAVTKE